MVATAIIMAFVFGVIFFVVRANVIQNMDMLLAFEAQKHMGEIEVVGDTIRFVNKAEWEEIEHREIHVNPIFIQLADKQGNLMDRSPNLKQNFLPFLESEYGGYFDASLDHRTIRMVQLPIEKNGEIKGYISAAISSESSLAVILRLRNVLLISYFGVLLGLYFISRFLAGRSIIPIQEMTNTISGITRNNLKERVSLPPNQDEIYTLSSSFNALIERIEKAIDREKQFTSDASHELRTPLASLRGTLEVLIRKQRTPQEYEEKIAHSLEEIDRMTAILEQLLLLARLESSSQENQTQRVPLTTLVDETISHHKTQISTKNLHVEVENKLEDQALVPYFYGKIILDNVLNNAVKYAYENSKIGIQLRSENGKVRCTVSDHGVGIKSEDLEKIYDHFYRSDALNHKHISGNGLGLAIVKKCADAIQAEVQVESTLGNGTTFTLFFTEE